MFISMMRHWKALKETLLLLAVYSATASVTALAQDNPLGQPLLFTCLANHMMELSILKQNRYIIR